MERAMALEKIKPWPNATSMMPPRMLTRFNPAGMAAMLNTPSRNSSMPVHINVAAWTLRINARLTSVPTR
ncbi:hypothetical protein D3C79_907320 [compost metagenome]